MRQDESLGIFGCFLLVLLTTVALMATEVRDYIIPPKYKEARLLLNDYLEQCVQKSQNKEELVFCQTKYLSAVVLCKVDQYSNLKYDCVKSNLKEYDIQNEEEIK